MASSFFVSILVKRFSRNKTPFGFLAVLIFNPFYRLDTFQSMFQFFRLNIGKLKNSMYPKTPAPPLIKVVGEKHLKIKSLTSFQSWEATTSIPAHLTG